MIIELLNDGAYNHDIDLVIVLIKVIVSITLCQGLATSHYACSEA